MNHIKSLFLLSLLSLLASCIDFDDATQTVSVAVQLEQPEGATVSLAGQRITLSGTETLSAITDANGVARFDDIVPGIYNISTAWKLTAREYAILTGQPQENKSYTVSGSLNALQLTGQSDPVTLPVTLTQDQSIVISKVYYNGSKDLNNRNYINGKYIELYNNSDETVDVAGLYVALLESESAVAYQPGQVPDTVFAKQVFRLPPSVPHPVPAGGSVLLVNSAIDHSVNGDFEPDLLDADYEATDSRGTHVNNPATPKLELIYTAYATTTYMNLVQGGPCSIVIFETDEDITQWPIVYAYGKTRGTRMMEIPTSAVIDGVEILKNRAQTGPDVNAKRLFDYIDATYAFTNTVSGYNGELVYRKVSATTDDGRPTLADTNNSLNDFGISSELKPRQYE